MSDQVKTVGRGFLAESTIEGNFYMPEEFVEFTGIPSSVESKPDAQQYTGIQAFYGCTNVEKIVESLNQIVDSKDFGKLDDMHFENIKSLISE